MAVESTPYFYDSYAVLAYLSGNATYKRYFEKETGILTILNLMEVYYGILRDYGEDAAEKAYSAAGKYNVEFDDHDIRAAMKKRLEYGKRKVNLSYADALGYEVAQRMGMKFLTGDESFEGLENVKFVK